MMWQALLLEEEVYHPPEDGWGERVYTSLRSRNVFTVETLVMVTKPLLRSEEQDVQHFPRNVPIAKFSVISTNNATHSQLIIIYGCKFIQSYSYMVAHSLSAIMMLSSTT